MIPEKLQFPIGKFQKSEIISAQNLEEYILIIEDFPFKLRNEVGHLKDEQLDTRYRPGGWTIRQVVSHCADSHANSFIRFKLALTEHKPVIKPYKEALWAELADSKSMPVEPSLKMLEGIHARWAILLKSFLKEDWAKRFVHPEHGKEFALDEAAALYAWHCNHHLAHIATLKTSSGWK